METTVNTSNVLLVDDDPQSIFVLEKVLSAYITHKAFSGYDAIALAEKVLPDLILLDVMMPQQDGFEVCEKLKDHPRLKDIPVIFITASSNPDELIKGFAVGAVDFISKPFNQSELKVRIRTHLELKKSKDVIYANNLALKKEIEYRIELEEKFRTLAELTYEAVFFIQDKTIIEANKSGLSLLGVEEVVMNHFTLQSLVREDEKNELHNNLESDEEGPWEMKFVNAKGHSFYGLMQHSKILFKNKPTEVITIRDISRQKQMDHEVMQAVMLAEEKERKRFARDLHDGLGALLSTVKIYVGLLQKENKSAEEKQNLIFEIKETINQAVNTTRSIANNLMPSVLMDYGLIKALLSFIESLQNTGIVQISHDFPTKVNKLDITEESHVYRIVLELINNTLKHAGANQIIITITENENGFRLDYMDNGKGLENPEVNGKKDKGSGLSNIMSRAQYLKGRAEFGNRKNYPFCFSLSIQYVM